MAPLFIFGARSTALEIAEAARSVMPSRRLIHVIGPEDDPAGLAGYCQLNALAATVPAEGGSYILSMADSGLRARCREAAERCGLVAESVIHPQAWVAPSAQVGPGCFLAPGSCVSTGARLGGHCIINLNATIGHDAAIGRDDIINPGAAISGRVRLGERVLVGANAFIYQGLEIGDDCRIDALAHVARSLAPGSLCTSRELRVFPRPGKKEN